MNLRFQIAFVEKTVNQWFDYTEFLCFMCKFAEQQCDSVTSGQGSNSRPEAEAVGGGVDHDLTERRHNNQDEDGHDLHEESETPLQRKHDIIPTCLCF